MIFLKFREVIVSSTMNADKGDLPGIELLQGLAVPDGDEPVLCSMQDVDRAVYLA